MEFVKSLLFTTSFVLLIAGGTVLADSGQKSSSLTNDQITNTVIDNQDAAVLHFPGEIWQEPVVQDVDVPAHAQNGVFYPEHTELVIVTPGEWKKTAVASANKQTLVVDNHDSKKCTDKDSSKKCVLPVQTVPVAPGAANPTATKVPQTENNSSLDNDSSLPDSFNQKITLKGTDLPLKVYFHTIAQATGVNVITTPDIDTQKASTNLENIEAWRALKTLLYKFGYGYKVVDNDLIVTPTETRVFNIKMPAVDQTFTDETSNESFANSQASSSGSSSSGSSTQSSQQVNVGTKIYYENKSPSLSLWTDLENNVKSIVTPKTGSYSINRASGTIIVTDTPQVLDKIGDLVNKDNNILSKQQSFEIEIIEVTLNNDYETGIDWNAIAKGLMPGGLNNISASTNFTASGFLSGQLLTLSAQGPTTTSGTSTGGVSAVLKALDSQGTIHVVSKPTITVSNLFPCIIQSVTSIPYISGVGTTIGNTTSQNNVQTSTVSTGLTMRLEGKIEDDKTVLNISAAENTLDSMTNVPVGGGLTIQEPQVSTKSITTNVSLEPNKSLILGGLMSSTKNNSAEGVPYLDKIPFFGGAFQYRGKIDEKTELVIIITPKASLKNGS